LKSFDGRVPPLPRRRDALRKSDPGAERWLVVDPIAVVVARR
jgi:hypothetical protein